MKIKTLLSLTCCLFSLSTAAGLLRADRSADLRNENIPPGHKMHLPLHRAIMPFASPGPTGYTPQQLRHAYGFDQLDTTGEGQTIAIVDAYGSPTIQADLDTFCTAMGIPSTTVKVYYPQGQPAANDGWATETSLDVEWAHAIAPGATIVLIVARSEANADLYAAVDYAVSLGATQVSMSWGGSEYSTEGTSDFHFNVPGVTFFASSGDNGAGVEYPSCSPYVAGVGGTTLDLDSSGNITAETAWSGSGGGVSAYETAPGYQAGWLTGTMRGVPDVAYDADPGTGVPVYVTGAGWGQYGGTSMGAPQWTALSALANSLRLSSINSAPSVFYSRATANYAGYYHDITSGSNGAYSAGVGYDLVTGLGTPLSNQLVVALAGGFSSQVATPVFFPGTGTYSSAQTVTILSATPGASIRFTTDGSTPTETVGTLYSGPVLIGANATLQAIAYASGLTTSPVNSGSYAFGSQVAAPAFTPAAGTYIFAQTVAISTTTSGAAIRYTTDGSTPSETVGTIYSGPVGIANTTVLNAIAYASGFIDSPVTDSVYTINPLNVLYNFTTSNNGGLQAGASLVQGNDGNFYGSTLQGGSGGCGTIFKITPAGVFTALAALNGANGNEPESALVQGSDGNFYGTTLYGGSGGTLGDGTVFKMTPAGVLTTLISFSGADGANPYGGLVQGSDGNFYGTTENGGSASDGTVFKITSAGVLTTLVSFDGANGAQPEATLVRGSDGNFYGTTQYGGSGSGKDGTVFKITPAGVLTTLVSFPGSAGNWPEGALPFAPLVQGSDGNFYGTTTYGGSNDFGTVFKMTPAGVLTTLVSFDNVNGAYPFAGLLQGRDGNFYGTTDGSGNDGNIFKITPAGVLTTLVSFTGGDAQFGEGPSGLVQGNDGNCYGVTTWGGSSDNGEIYQLLLPPQLPQAAAPVFSPAAGTYSSAQMVTITSATSGAAIRYTTDGSTPTETNGTLYSGPVSIGTTTTLQAIAYETGFTDSGVTSGLYTIGSGSITVSSSTGFDNIPMSSAQSGAFTASFDASPSLSPSNATMALCKGAQTAYTGLSCIARFNTSGDIDAYNGSSGYQAASVIPFSKGLTYHFRMVVNVPVSTYSVYVTPPGSSEVLVGSNYGFRKAATSLDTWDIDVNKSPGGSVTVSNLSVSGSGGTVAAPSFSPPAGTYTSAQAVIINDSTSGASIRYTTDGVTTPTETVGTLYTGSISIGTTTTLKAIAYESGMTDSTVTSGQYTISTPQVAAPSFSPAAGTYTSVQTVTITTTTSGASIRYTTDGVTTPTETVGTLYTGSISIGTTTTLKTIAYESGMTDSTVTTGLYTINQPQVVAPVFSPVAGTYTTAQTVTISTTTSGASIRYTTDGSAPSETAGTLYTGSISISTTTTLKAIAYKTGMTDSTVTTGLYTISTTSQVAAPAFSPGAGTYTSAQAVKITTTTSGASIRYTIDGSTPSETAGTLYSGPVSISTTTTLKAIGYETGFIDSSVTSGLYTINPTTRSLTGTSSNGFHALALTVAQTGTFTATFDATPSVSPENAVVGLSKGVATAYGNLSCIARFNPSGQIDAYSGTGYITSTIPYSAGVTYHFSMVVNVSAHTYSVYVTPAGKSQLTVGTNLAFRSTANAVTSLDTWNLDVNATPSGCSLTANNLNP